MNVLESYIYDIHECISGVCAKPHTRQFIHEELTKVYENFQKSVTSRPDPAVSFSIDIYEVIHWNLISFIISLFIGYLGKIFYSNEMHEKPCISFHNVPRQV